MNLAAPSYRGDLPAPEFTEDGLHAPFKGPSPSFEMYKGDLHAAGMSKGDTFDPEEVHTRLRELVEELGESRGPASLGPEEGGPPLFLAPAYEAGLLSSFDLLLSASAANGALASLVNKLIMVGQESSGTSISALLQDSLVTQGTGYVSAFHTSKL